MDKDTDTKTDTDMDTSMDKDNDMTWYFDKDTDIYTDTDADMDGTLKLTWAWKLSRAWTRTWSRLGHGRRHATRAWA